MRDGTTANKSKFTNDDHFTVFLNQQKDFVLKLTLHETDSSSLQIRIVELASIFDEELNKASYEKLLELIVAAVGYDFNTNALKLTYQDSENDAVVVSSTRELSYAIRQFYDEDGGPIKFVGNIQQHETPSKKPEANIKNTLPLVAAPAAVPAVVVPAAATWTLPITPLHAPDAKWIPTDFAERVAGPVDFPTIRFDASRVAAGLTLDHDNRRVTQTGNSDKYRFVYSKDGIASGCKYWSFKIIDNGSCRIGFGISTDPPPSANHLVQSLFPNTIPGVLMDLSSGNFCSGNKYTALTNARLVKTSTVIGVLLNMNHKTVTFYADGQRVGIGGGSDVLTQHEYFPVIALYELGSCVEVMDLVPPTLH